MSPMKLTAFNYGTTELAENQIFPGGDPQTMCPIALLFFLIETEERRILVDTGCDTMPGFTLFTHLRPVDLLKTYGLEPGDITDVAITHAHHDHSDCLRYYPQARLIAHPAELKKLKQDHTGEIIPVETEHEIVPGVKIKHIGGHSAGSCVVLMDQGSRKLVLCGDECYTPENLRDGIPTGCSCCSEKSRWFVEEYGKNLYEPIIFHDPAILAEIGFRVLAE